MIKRVVEWMEDVGLDSGDIVIMVFKALWKLGLFLAVWKFVFWGV